MKQMKGAGGMTSQPQWKKSSFSGPNGDCVEFAAAVDGSGDVLVRHSKRLDEGVLRYSADEWRAFVAGVKAGEFDL